MSRTNVRVTFRTRSRLREVSAEILERVETGMEGIREAIAADAEANAPRLTGELAGSIGVDGDKVVADSPHALFVEKGTVYMAAQPFMGPAVARGRELVKALLADIRASIRGL